MMWRLHMQYFGLRVELKRMSPSGNHTGSMSETPFSRVSCARPVPSALTV